MGSDTRSATSAAVAPGYEVRTFTKGGAVSGNSWIGKAK